MTFSEFIETRRSKATRKTYARVSRILGLDPDALAELARRDKRGAEDQIMRAIAGRRESATRYTLAAATTITMIAAMPVLIALPFLASKFVRLLMFP